MSHVRAENIGRPGGQAIPMNTVLQGTAKAWFNLNGTGTITPRDDFNISSYVDNGTGDYTSNFATAMPNANYVSSLAVSGVGSGNRMFLFASTENNANNYSDVAPTTAAMRFAISLNAGTPTDVSRVFVAFHGDPA